MTMQPGVGLESGPSVADAAALQGQDQGQQQGYVPEGAEPDLGEQLSALIDERLQARLTVIDRRIQSFTDRLINQYGGLAQRIEALAAQAGATAEIRDLVTDLHEATVDPSDRERRALERKVARLEREQALPPPVQQPQPQQQEADPAEYETRFYAEIAPDLEDYARLRGFSAAELQAANWMNRLYAAGAPQEIDYSPQGIRAYKERMKRALDTLAQQGAASRRGRTAPPNPVSAGGGARNYSNVAVGDIPDAEFLKNFEDVARAVVAKNRR